MFEWSPISNGHTVAFVVSFNYAIFAALVVGTISRAANGSDVGIRTDVSYFWPWRYSSYSRTTFNFSQRELPF